jgi:hypothetical protein
MSKPPKDDEALRRLLNAPKPRDEITGKKKPTG